MYNRLSTKEDRENARATALQGYTVQTFEDVKTVAGIKDIGSGQVLYKIFDGTAGRPSEYYRAISEERAQRAIDKHVQNRRESLKRKAEYKAQNNQLSSHANTAQKMRERLKAEFPGVKFSVKSESYSGGNSIHVEWVDGPVDMLVERIAKQYQHGSFDGMTDMYEYVSVSASLECSGVSYVFTERCISPEHKTELQAHYDARFTEGNPHFCYNYGDGTSLNHEHYEQDTPEIWAEEYQKLQLDYEQKERDHRAAEQAEYETQRDAERAAESIAIKTSDKPRAGGKVVDFVAYRESKQQHAESDKHAEAEQARDDLMLEIMMSSVEELNNIIRACATDLSNPVETRRDMCRLLIGVLKERDSAAAMRIFQEVKYLFQ